MTVGTMFGHATWDYDRARRQLVPGFDRFYEAVLESIPFGEQQEIRVLDLGAGTGLLSAVVAGKFPRARVTLVDLSVEMLRVARRRFAGEQGRFEFRTGPWITRASLCPEQKEVTTSLCRRSRSTISLMATRGSCSRRSTNTRRRRTFRQRRLGLRRDVRGGGALQGMVAAAGARGRGLGRGSGRRAHAHEGRQERDTCGAAGLARGDRFRGDRL